jgi:hypothetical protein
MKRYKLNLLVIENCGSRAASWTFVKEPVSGTEHEYRVKDGNYAKRNSWTFVVRVPNRRNGRIEVRPTKVPNLQAWSELQMRALMFSPATRSDYRGSFYCQLNLADATGSKTKDVVGWGERDDLPRWLQRMRHRMRLKKTIMRKAGNDGYHQVILVRPDDHERMIRVFFATKVWVLKEHVVLGG